VQCDQQQQQQQGLHGSQQQSAWGRSRQRQREHGGPGWQQAVLLKQLGGVQSSTQQHVVQDNDRWQME
jgi:hypothetical protein